MIKTRTEITDIILAAIEDVAPDADTEGLDFDEDFRDELELDSMDVLNILIALEKACSVKVADADGNNLLTLNSMVDYLLARIEP